MNNPLYETGISTEGKRLVGGVFTLKNQAGFPLASSFEILKEQGRAIDYCELLCAAWLHDCLGFDSVTKELDMLEGSHVEDWKRCGASFLSRHPKAMRQVDPINVFCRYTLQKKRINAPI